MRKLNKNNGITLIALVISIIVMLILVAVSISMVVNGGLFNYAGKAVGETENSIGQEQNLIDDIINNYIKPNTNKDNAGGEGEENGGTTPENPETPNEGDEGETISTTESYIGYYADIDGDGTVDGVIYADLAKANSGTWNPERITEEYATTGGTWSYNVETNLKEYVVSKDSYEGDFGTKPIIKASSTEGTDRFYVMALSDVNPGITYCWYDAAFDDGISDYTNYSYEFGTGKTNTHNMIEAWNGKEYGAQNDGLNTDVWGVIQETVYGINYDKENKTEEDVIWFLPSANEWAAFGSAFGIKTKNFSSTYGLKYYYCSSSLYDTGKVYRAHFAAGCVNCGNLSVNYSVRLSATF